MGAFNRDVTWRLAGAVAMATILSWPVRAAETKEEGEAGIEAIEADHPGFLKRTVDRFLSDGEPGGDGKGLHLGPLAPRFEVVSPGAGPAPMLHFWAPDIGHTGLDLHASGSYSVYKYQYYDAQFGLVPHEDARLPRMARGTNGLFTLDALQRTAAVPGFQIWASGRYRDYPREDFYGVGLDTARDARSDYRLKDSFYEGLVRYGRGPLSFLGRAGVLQTSILSGDDPDLPDTLAVDDENSAPGLLRAPDFFVASGGLWLELRDQPGNPHRGASLGLAVSRFDDRGGRAFQWTRVAVDAREYIPLGSDRHVLAFRQVASLDDPDEGAQVPFYLQTTLGGSLFLPGYGSFRFRDDNAFLLVGEYRFEVHPKVELALLYDAGSVFPTLDAFEARDMRRSYGVGLRLKSPQKVKVRLDVWHSDESTQVRLKLGPSF